MLAVLSPAKKLDYNSSLACTRFTQPLFVPQAAALIEVLRQKSAADIQALMKLSESLAELNVERYAQWSETFNLDNARQAIFAFNGDVYEGLQAHLFNDTQLNWAQDHLAILSGLYGVLRPLDLMQAYRLEMGTKLITPSGRNLYEYWGSTIAKYLQERLEAQHNPVLLNLASEEYFKSVDLSTLKAPVVQCVFQENKNGSYKVISFHAKRARGLMARYIIEQSIDQVDALKDFHSEDYRYDATVSDTQTLVFRRE